MLADHPFLDLRIAEDDHVSARPSPKQRASLSPKSDVEEDFEEFAPIPPHCAIDREVSERKGRTVLKFWYEDPDEPCTQ
jgi:hypothetical protein